MKFICESATVTTQRMRTYLRRNRIDVLLLLLVLIVSLTACSQSQGLPETSGASMTDDQEWECQEIFLEDGIPYSMDEQGNRIQLGDALQPPAEWKNQDLGGRNEATTLIGNPDVQGELISPTDGWLVVTYTKGDTYVYKTSDGGSAWIETNAPDILYVPGAVGFINEDRLIIAEKLFVEAPVFITKDGGENWEQIEMPDELTEVKSIDVTGEKIIMSAQHGDEEWEITSLDLGDTWSITQSLQ